MPSAATTPRFDTWTVLLTTFLVGVGLVMLYSSSADTAADISGDHMFFLKRQLTRALLGAALLFACSRLDYHHLKKYANWLLLGSLALLTISLLLHYATGREGTARWLWLGPVSIQPSDFARLSLIIYLAAYLDRKGSQLTSLARGFLPPVVVIALMMVLIIPEPDFSTAALTGLLGCTLLFLGGARARHLAGLVAASLPLMGAVMIAEPYRRIRIQSFLGLIDSPRAEYQISQSLISLGNGGWLGQGLGNSVEKKLFLPAPHTDFVFAIIGEELGFIGAVLLLAAFFWLFQRAIVIARHAPDRFGMLLALGTALNLIIYVMVNTAVVTEVVPNTGIPLPLISYGGTHLVFTLISLGILLNISASTRRRRWDRQLVYAKARS
ncbi:MAG: putative lipid II flippase FtsW [Candidatus Neomarinimicrobiota bacterium]